MNTDKFLKETNVVKMVLSLSIPAMISSVIDSLYNTIDSIFVGHYVGDTALASLAIINVIQLLYLAIGVLFLVGNASIISRALGAQHPERAVKTLIHSFWGVFIFSNIISFSILLRLDDFLRFIGASEELLPYARDYGSIILLTGFILPVNTMLLGALRAKGLVLQATYLIIIGAVTNVVLDAFFIVQLGWGVKGAAVATAIAQCITFIFVIKKVKKEYHTKLLFHSKSEINFSLFYDILFIGFPTGLRLILFVVALSFANVLIGPYGSEYLSAFGIFNRIINLFSMIIVSLTFGAQPLIGLNYGAQLYDRVELIIISTLKIGVGMTLIISSILLWAPTPLFRMFTENTAIIEICQTIFRIFGLTYWMWGFFICIAEALQAMGHAKQSFILSLSYPCFVITFFLILPKIFGLMGVWLSYTFSFALVGIFAIIILKFDLKKMKDKMNNIRNSV